MGMFDNVRLDNIELPDLTKTSSLDEYQTKDLDCELHNYRVTSDGRLVRKVRDEEVWKPTSFSGVFHAYRYDGGPDLRLGFNSGHLWSVSFI